MIALPFLLFALVFAGLWLGIYNLVPAGTMLGVGLMRRLLRQADRHRHFAKLRKGLGGRLDPWRSYVPVAALAVAGALLSLAAGSLFMELVEGLQEQSPALQRFDQSVWRDAANYRNDPGTVFFNFFTVVGTPVVLGIVVFLVSIVLWRRDHIRWAAYLVLTTVLGGVLNLILKEWFARARPDLAAALRHASGYSFPSGHAMGSIVVCGALLYLALRAFSSWKARSGAIAAAITIVATIALSRIYLGVHWISDIVAGLSAGFLWVATTTLSYELYRRIRHERLRAQNSRAGEG